ncbi:hypothetical protein [Actinomyces oris]|uniref:variant leucine-rich repeat-containing protein n=1 Tax=Actinomyces oris TaxID=544580 RepID=UPI00094D017D|nr:hypothetical protein [Actinomyces oris]OLO75027.1 hypothetical protein BKH16_09430 [Actinomyces oris]
MTAVAHAAPGPADPDTVSRTPDDPDLQLARDPRAGAGRLMVLAGNRPDLRGVIADNPGCSPELRAWVSRMGGASAGSGRRGPEAAAARTDGSGGADDPDDAVSLAPTGWEPSDIGLGDEPFGSVLGDPLMGSPLFDDDGSRHEPTDADPTEPSGAAARNDKGGRRAPSSRRTARPHTASAHTAPARTASRTAAARVTQAPPTPAAAGGDDACTAGPDAAWTLHAHGALPGAGVRGAGRDCRRRPGPGGGRPLGRGRSARRRPADHASVALRCTRESRRLLRDGALQRPSLLAQRQEDGPVIAVQHEPGQDPRLDPLRPAVHRHPGPQRLRREGAGARPQGAGAPQGAAEPGVEPLGALAAGMVIGLLEA